MVAPCCPPSWCSSAHTWSGVAAARPASRSHSRASRSSRSSWWAPRARVSSWTCPPAPTDWSSSSGNSFSPVTLCPTEAVVYGTIARTFLFMPDHVDEARIADGTLLQFRCDVSRVLATPGSAPSCFSVVPAMRRSSNKPFCVATPHSGRRNLFLSLSHPFSLSLSPPHGKVYRRQTQFPAVKTFGAPLGGGGSGGGGILCSFNFLNDRLWDKHGPHSIMSVLRVPLSLSFSVYVLPA